MASNKSDKSSQADKSDKTAANKLTEKAGLAFNINTVKASMKNYFEVHAEPVPMFSGSHTAMTAVVQKMAQLILKLCLDLVSKDKSGIKKISRPDMKTAICLDNSMKDYFYLKIVKFDKKCMYGDILPIARKEFDTFCTSVDKDMTLTPKAFNFLAYLLNQVYLDCLSTAHQFMSHAKKKTLDGTSVMYAAKNRFSDSISVDLCNEAKRALVATGDEVENVAETEDKDTDKKQDTGAEDSGDEAEAPAPADGKKDAVSKETKPKKPTKPKADAKPATGKQPPVQKVEDDEDNSQDKDKDNENDPVDAPAPATTTTTGSKKPPAEKKADTAGKKPAAQTKPKPKPAKP